MRIVIDDEFKSLIPPLTQEEYQGLSDSIQKEGCRDALVLWGDILVDGHNRYEICERFRIPFKTVQMDFKDRNEAMLWMMHNQLARRNLNDFQRVEITHKCEEAVKAKAEERLHLSKGRGQKGVEKLPQVKARDELGALAGVSGKTYEHAVDVMKKAPKPVVDAARKNDLSIHTAYQVTKMEPEEQEEIAVRIVQGEKPKDVVREIQIRPHVVNNSRDDEWYTPARYIEAARQVLGEIDLDPASNDFANETVKAKTYYTEETDGLSQKWFGNIWMNPPYSTALLPRFAEKLVNEDFEQAIVLVNNATETQWFKTFVGKASAIVFHTGRIKFVKRDGEHATPLQGQAFFYYGNNADKFLEVFGEFGWGAKL